MRVVALILVAAAVAPHLEGQNPAALTRGARIRVVTAEDRVAEGSLVLLRGDTVVIADSAQRTVNGRFAGYEPRERTFALGQGTHLQLFTGYRSHAITGALIGAGLGLVLGVALGSASGPDSPSLGPASGAILLAVPGMLVGGALGAIMRTPAWDPVATSGVTVALDQLDRVRVGVVVTPAGHLGLGASLAFGRGGRVARR